MKHKSAPLNPVELDARNPIEPDNKCTQIVEIEDPRFEESYTAYVMRTSTGWSGRIPDIPEVKMCHGTTQNTMLESLKDNLHEVLKARSDTWDKQIEEDIKAGKLDHLREEILEDIKNGRLTDL